jgi:NADH-quinone oxidoreductase subunit L
LPEVFVHGGDKLAEFLSPVIPDVTGGEVSHSTEILLMGLTTVVAIVAILIAWTRYKNYREDQPTPFGKVLENKWYVDELYDKIIVRPINKLSIIANKYFERSGIDAVVNGVGKLVNYGSRQMRWLQSGQVGNYVLLMVISMLLFFVLQFFLRK